MCNVDFWATQNGQVRSRDPRHSSSCSFGAFLGSRSQGDQKPGDEEEVEGEDGSRREVNQHFSPLVGCWPGEGLALRAGA